MTLVANIQAVFYQATASEIEYGIAWYSIANKTAERLAKAYGVPFLTVCGVIAALSPNARWEQNIQSAEKMLTAFNLGNGIDSFTVTTYSQNKKKAWEILSSGEGKDGIIRLLNGVIKLPRLNKTANFFLNIAFPESNDYVTIDGHAKNITLGIRQTLANNATVSPKEYPLLVEAYRQATEAINRAEGTNYRAHEIQAITWVCWRRLHKI